MSDKRDVSPPTLHRLSIYLRCLRSLEAQGVTTTSSLELARRYELSAAQIRKDLAHFGEFGIRGVGYKVEELTSRLREILGLARHHPTIVVGVGNLGSALLQFLMMGEAAFRAVAAADNDPRKIGQKIGGVTVSDAADLVSVVQSSGAEIGVLTIPPEATQKNYDRLVEAGIRGVLNFAPIRLQRSPGVLTRTVDLRIFFEELGFRLQRPDASAE